MRIAFSSAMPPRSTSAFARRQAQLHRLDQALAAGQIARIATDRAPGVGDAGGALVVEGVHEVLLVRVRVQARLLAARQTRSAVAGIGHVPDAERVGQRVDEGRRRADRAGLAAALDAQRVVGAGRDRVAELDVGDVVGARHRVVHVRAGQQLARLGVVDGSLPSSPGRGPAPGRRAPGPATIIGLTMLPKSSTAMKCSICTLPVSGSTSTSQT